MKGERRGDVEITDVTGTPESDSEIRKAIDMLGRIAIDPIKYPPEVAIYSMTARRGLEELLVMRDLLQRAKERVSKNRSESKGGDA